ncbi:hypothetical protein AA0616_2487 [Komagataeibacter nataicola NRIC 0616]|nr:hypothetical protein [Komagataeibacter nataicola]GBR23300.1 hypothetical protein AA0616_2487 [Komagataeibacter nataicola NRIC 0616]
MSGYGSMNIVRFKAVEDGSRDDLAVLLNAHHGEGRIEQDAKLIGQETGDAAILFVGKDYAGHAVF